MATMTKEKDFQINPLVPDSILHNTKTLSNLHSLTASLFGVTAGILGLESYAGFLLYILLSAVTTLLFYAVHVAPTSKSLDAGMFFRGGLEFWSGGVVNGFAGFVLTWTLFYGLVRV